jgi:hypothetical protein
MTVKTVTACSCQTPNLEGATVVVQPDDAQHMAKDEGDAGQSGAAIVETSPQPAPGTEQTQLLTGNASGGALPSANGPDLVTMEVQVAESGDGKAADDDDIEAKGGVVTRRASSRKSNRPDMFSPVAETKAKRTGKGATGQAAMREGSSDPQIKADGGLGAGNGGVNQHDAAKDEEVRFGTQQKS